MGSPAEIPDPTPSAVKRAKACGCCQRKGVRELRPVGKATDGGYAVAVCPRCDLLQERPKPAPRRAAG